MRNKSLAKAILGFFVLAGMVGLLGVGSRAGSPSGSAAAASSSLSPEQKIVIKTENGIPVVYNPKDPAPPAGGPTSLTLKLDLTIGQESGDENYIFADIQYVLVDDQENIYALDGKDVKIKVFDKTGTFLRAFGKKGQGPGEIGSPSRLEAAPGGKVILSDAGNHKFLYFSRDGTVQRELLMGKFSTLNRFKLDSQGAIYAAIYSFGGPSGDSMTWEIKKFSADFQLLGTLASVEEKRAGQVLKAYSPSLALAVTGKDNVIWAVTQTDKYEVTVAAPDGKALRKIIKDWAPAAITAAGKSKLIKDNFGDRGIPPGYTFEVPDHYPALLNFVIDDRDGLFVRTYAYESKAGQEWISHDVFDAEGRYVARFSLPEGEMVFAVRKDKLYSRVAENDQGIPQVKRYAMIWK